MTVTEHERLARAIARYGQTVAEHGRPLDGLQIVVHADELADQWLHAARGEDTKERGK